MALVLMNEEHVSSGKWLGQWHCTQAVQHRHCINKHTAESLSDVVWLWPNCVGRDVKGDANGSMSTLQAENSYWRMLRQGQHMSHFPQTVLENSSAMKLRKCAETYTPAAA